MKSLCLLLLALAAPSQEPEEVLEGHSAHGEAFNQGPRQAAHLLPVQADVHFPISTQSEEVQRFFDQGVSFLHGFWFFEAERSFRHAASLEPDCAMSYWGMAMANVDNEQRAAGFARRAWLGRESVSPRERLYIESIARFHEVEGEDTPRRLQELDEEQAEKDERARQKKRKARAERLTRDYEEIVWEHPDDLEAKAILVNRLWLNRRFGIPTSSRLAIEALLQQIFALKPDHPSHHYRIHLWDADDSAARVVESALATGPSLPTVAHMWHMGGHIFDRLGRHGDAAWQQEASARVDHAHMMREWVLPDRIHNFAHNNEWLTRSLRHHGRVREAVDLARNMIELPRHPAFNTLDQGDCSASWGRQRLLETLELYERWEELVQLSRTMYLEPSEEAGDRAERAHRLAKAHAFLGDWPSFELEQASLEAALSDAKERRVLELEEAEEGARADGADSEQVRAAMDSVLSEHQAGLDSMRDQLEALDALRQALAGEEPGESHDVLKKRGFQRSHLALLSLAAGASERAVELAREAAANKSGELYPAATLAHVLYQSGAREEALELFDELRAWTARADLELPVMQRLLPLAEERGLPADWRPADALAADIPEEARPELDELGPLRWTPIEAPDWTRPDGFDHEISLSDYRGRPVIVILFLGFGCVHCVEQLQAFAPAYERFRDEGIELVAVGTDTPEQLHTSRSGRSEEEAYPFDIVSDAELGLFKSWRAFDDFEQVPLHGTFLVDGEGRIRWLDISFEPFMDWEFLLEESVRLLGLPSTLGIAPGPEDVEQG